MPNYLTPMKHYADNQTYGTSPQGSGYEYLHRSVCRPAEESARKGGTLRRRTGGTFGDSSHYTLQLGIRRPHTNQRRSLKSCGSPRSEHPYTDTKRVSRRLSSPILTSIFQASKKFSTALAPIFVTRRDLAKIHVPGIQESKEHSERIFAKFSRKSPNVYNALLQYPQMRITISLVKRLRCDSDTLPAPTFRCLFTKTITNKGQGFFTYKL